MIDQVKQHTSISLHTFFFLRDSIVLRQSSFQKVQQTHIIRPQLHGEKSYPSSPSSTELEGETLPFLRGKKLLEGIEKTDPSVH